MAKKIGITAALAALILLTVFYFYPRELLFEYHEDTAKVPLKRDEIEALRRIHLDCFEATYRKYLTAYLKESYDLRTPEQLALLESKMDKAMEGYRDTIARKYDAIKNLYVVKLSGKTIGEFTCTTDNDFTHGDPILYDLCLDPEKRGQGYGSQMTEYAIEYCSKPQKPLVLTVYKDQTSLVKLYEKLGFEISPFEQPADSSFKYYNKYLMRFKGKKPKG